MKTKMEKKNGILLAFNANTRTGIIEETNGQRHFVRPQSFRKTTLLKPGDTVSFISWNLYEGATASDIEPRQ